MAAETVLARDALDRASHGPYAYSGGEQVIDGRQHGVRARGIGLQGEGHGW